MREEELRPHPHVVPGAVVGSPAVVQAREPVLLTSSPSSPPRL